MNILPKKRWHVRTKENIARVRRDEAQAAEEEKERQKRAQLAESEARIEALRKKAKLKQQDDVIEKSKPDFSNKSSVCKHINFFEELEEGKVVSDAKNAEHEQEKKEEKEKYEKQIGYLTYLGQDTVEATGKISWYNKVPERGTSSTSDDATDRKKMLLDPLRDIRRYLSIKHSDSSIIRKRKYDEISPKSGSGDKKHKGKKRKTYHKEKDKRKKNKRHKSPSSSSSSGNSSNHSETESETESNSNLEKLRAERLKREQQEHKRAEALLAKIRGEPEPEEKPPPAIPYQRYNSQFNPDIARQNKIIN